MKFYGSISRRLIRTAVLTATVAAVIAGTSLTHVESATAAAPVANDSPVTSKIVSPDDITPAMLEQARQDLEASNAAKSTSADGTETFTLSNGLTLSFSTSDEPTSRLGFGKEKNGQLYVAFNQFDQDMLMTGMTVALGAAVCAATGLGAVACPVVAAIISFGMVAVATNGKCKSNKQLIVHVSPSWSTCR